jgi:simple sugar transport system permease protein
VALVVLQLLSSGLNLLGASQHLATAVWGMLLVAVMILRWLAGQAVARIERRRRR